MGHSYNYTPAYYSSFHDTITTLCKSILQPLSLKSRSRLPDQKLAERHSDTLKWQQESFHRILHLTGLHKEGIVPESEVIAFRSHLLDTLVASPPNREPVAVIRDKLLFLQELFYAKCISADEYHSSKRPLLQRLAVQRVEIDCRDVIIGSALPETSAEEWSVLDLGPDEETPMKETSTTKTPGIKSLMGHNSSWRGIKGKKETDVVNSIDKPSILLPESSPLVPVEAAEKAKRRPFRALFHKEQQRDQTVPVPEERMPKSSKKHWGFDGFRKWKKCNSEDKSSSALYQPLGGERSDDSSSSVPCTLVASPISKKTDNTPTDKGSNGGSGRWVSFGENDENFHPNLFCQGTTPSPIQGVNGKMKDSSSNSISNSRFVNNPFHDDDHKNPFWTPSD